MDDNQGKLPLLFKCFRDSLIGKNTKGIIHNINSPLQVLSMQIELLRMDLFKLRKDTMDVQKIGPNDKEGWTCCVSIMDRCLERLSQVDEVAQRINSMIAIIAGRVNEIDDQGSDAPVMLNQILEEQTEFWRSDLFFKHKVALSMNLPGISPVVVIREDILRDTIDGIIFACLEQVRMEAAPRIDISLSSEPAQGMKQRIFFSQNGPRFHVEEIGELINRFSEKGLRNVTTFENIPQGHFSLVLASICAGIMGFQIQLSENQVVFEFQAASEQ